MPGNPGQWFPPSVMERREKSREVEYCPMCHEWKPLGDFMGVEVSYDPMVNPVVCQHCRDHGPPPPDSFPMLPMRQRKAIRLLAEGADFADVARACGIQSGNLRRMLEGQDRGQAFRRAFQIMLEEAGLDSISIVRTLKQTIRAERFQWNPSREEFQAFPDYNVRLRTAQTLAKHHQLEHPREVRDRLSGGPAVNVIIRTNLDGRPRSDRARGMQAISTQVSDDGKTLTIGDQTET